MTESLGPRNLPRTRPYRQARGEQIEELGGSSALSAFWLDRLAPHSHFSVWQAYAFGKLQSVKNQEVGNTETQK